jgi:hypothetical protein
MDKTERKIKVDKTLITKSQSIGMDQSDSKGAVINSFLHFCLYVSFVQLSQLESIQFVIVLNLFGIMFRPHHNLLVAGK